MQDYIYPNSQLQIASFETHTFIVSVRRQNEAMLVPVRTLSEMRRRFGEERRRISYLKVDVEGSEIKAGQRERGNLSQ